MNDTVKALRRRCLRLYLQNKQSPVAMFKPAALRKLLTLSGVEVAKLEAVMSTLATLDLSVEAGRGGYKVQLQGSAEPDGVREVFDYWRKQSGHPRAKLSPLRRSRIVARRKDGFTIEQLKAAIDGMLSSDFHRVNGHDDLELALRSIEKVEGFESRASYLRVQDRSESVQVPSALTEMIGVERCDDDNAF